MPNSIFGIFSPLGFKLITGLRLGLSHLNEHRFNHNLSNCINPLCNVAWMLSQWFTFLSITTIIIALEYPFQMI